MKVRLIHQLLFPMFLKKLPKMKNLPANKHLQILGIQITPVKTHKLPEWTVPNKNLVVLLEEHLN